LRFRLLWMVDSLAGSSQCQRQKGTCFSTLVHHFSTVPKRYTRDSTHTAIMVMSECPSNLDDAASRAAIRKFASVHNFLDTSRTPVFKPPHIILLTFLKYLRAGKGPDHSRKMPESGAEEALSALDSGQFWVD
jgi:hypothetical protein